MNSLIALTCMALVAGPIAFTGCRKDGEHLQEGTSGSTGATTGTNVASTTTSGSQNGGNKSNTGTTGDGSGSTTGATTGQQVSQHRFIEDRVFQLDKLQRAQVKVDKHTFNLWVMDNDSKRSEGMMFLKKEDFKDDEGMIFAFPNEGDQPRRFWMRNTLVDLDIAYCDKDGMINSVYTMKALDEDSDYSSKRPSMYVIEVRDGTFKKLGIKPGMRFIIPEEVVAKD